MADYAYDLVKAFVSNRSAISFSPPLPRFLQLFDHGPSRFGLIFAPLPHWGNPCYSDSALHMLFLHDNLLAWYLRYFDRMLVHILGLIIVIHLARFRHVTCPASDR